MKRNKEDFRAETQTTITRWHRILPPGKHVRIARACRRPRRAGHRLVCRTVCRRLTRTCIARRESSASAARASAKTSAAASGRPRRHVCPGRTPNGRTRATPKGGAIAFGDCHNREAIRPCGARRGNARAACRVSRDKIRAIPRVLTCRWRIMGPDCTVICRRCGPQWPRRLSSLMQTPPVVRAMETSRAVLKDRRAGASRIKLPLTDAAPARDAIVANCQGLAIPAPKDIEAQPSARHAGSVRMGFRSACSRPGVRSPDARVTADPYGIQIGPGTSHR